MKPFVSLPGFSRIKSEKNSSPQPVVILIHGLDNPDLVWMNLAPALLKNNFYVLIMTYPNDQSIQESDRLVCDHLGAFFLKEKIASATIVTHSMGGLVAREMLTSPELSYGKKAETGLVPHIHTLIMVAPPNHGSHLARFRLFMEVRDQIHQWLKTDYHWLNSIFDGAGEGGLDLIPGSRFLTQLNARPHPDQLNIQVIAGQASPWTEKQIHAFMKNIGDTLPFNLGQTIHPLTLAMEKILMSMTHILGDGLVSLDSARLEGVPFKAVEGTHLTMIRNLSSKSQRTPPALPLILSLLKP